MLVSEPYPVQWCTVNKENAENLKRYGSREARPSLLSPFGLGREPSARLNLTPIANQVDYVQPPDRKAKLMASPLPVVIEESAQTRKKRESWGYSGDAIVQSAKVMRKIAPLEESVSETHSKMTPKQLTPSRPKPAKAASPLAQAPSPAAEPASPSPAEPEKSKMPKKPKPPSESLSASVSVMVSEKATLQELCKQREWSSLQATAYQVTGKSEHAARSRLVSWQLEGCIWSRAEGGGPDCMVAVVSGRPCEALPGVSNSGPFAIKAALLRKKGAAELYGEFRKMKQLSDRKFAQVRRGNMRFNLWAQPCASPIVERRSPGSVRLRAARARFVRMLPKTVETHSRESLVLCTAPWHRVHSL